MIVEFNSTSKINIDITEEEAFRILCRAYSMEFVLDEDTDYFVRKDSYGENAVYKTKNGHDCKVDDRGDLFIALRNVAVCIFGNLRFRSDDYIRQYGDKL